MLIFIIAVAVTLLALPYFGLAINSVVEFLALCFVGLMGAMVLTCAVMILITPPLWPLGAVLAFLAYRYRPRYED